MAQPTKLVFKSLRLYLEDYKDTSNSKQKRVESLIAASTLVSYIIHDLIADHPVGVLLKEGFVSIEDKVKAGIIYQQTLQNFDSEIGFLLILEQ